MNRLKSKFLNQVRHLAEHTPGKIRIAPVKLIPYCLVFIALLIGVLLVQHDYNWYSTTIVRIESAANELSSQSKGNETGEKHFDQKLTGTVMNGEYAGHKVTMQNSYSSSEVYDEQYRAGDDVFVSAPESKAGKLTANITNLKRDSYVACLAALIILLIFIAAKRKGLLSVLSLSINIGFLYFALSFYAAGQNILLLMNGLVLLFTFSSLLFIGGLTKKTFTAIFATLATLFVTMMIFLIVMHFTDGVDYAFMEYIASPNDLPEIFLSQILIGGLGAIMDVAITEAATVSELTEKDSGISVRDLLKSGREVGYDIMGTMINVMLFTYISGSIPLIILKMKSEVRLHTIILWHMPMEMYRFLIGSIGILLTIPISLFISIAVFKKSRRFS